MKEALYITVVLLLLAGCGGSWEGGFSSVEDSDNVSSQSEWTEDTCETEEPIGGWEFAEVEYGTECQEIAENLRDERSLHEAVRRGDSAGAAFLLDRGVDVNAVRDYGTPLHFAILNDHKEIVQLLIERGADLDKGYPVNSWARYEATPLHLAARSDQCEIAAILLASGMPVDVKDAYGNTALHMAAAYGHYDAAYLLIAHGADVNASDKYSQTPLDMAVCFDNCEVESLLRSRGGVCGNR